MGLTHRSRNVKTIILWSFLGALAFGCILAWSLSIFGTAPSALKTELEKATHDGMPVEPNDLRRLIVVPKDQNAAPLLTGAFKKLGDWSASKDGKEFTKLVSVLRSDKSLSPTQFAALRQAVRSASGILADLKEAVKLPLVDFNRDWGKGPALLLPEYALARTSCSLLLAQARIDFADAKDASALTAMDSAARLTKLIGQEPIIISLLVFCSLQSQVLRDLDEEIKKHPADLPFLEQSRSIVNAIGATPDIRPAIGAELMSGRIAVKMLAHQGGAQVFGDNGGKMAVMARFGPARSVYELRYVEVMHKLYTDLGKNPKSFLAMRKVFEGIDQRLGGNSDWSYGLAEFMSPAFGGMAQALGAAQARRNVTLSAIDLLESKSRLGAIPRTIGGTAGQWQDPFTEKPLLYHRSDTGFLIYSVGPDGKDNGGKPRSKEMSDTNYDIPFKFP